MVFLEILILKKKKKQARKNYIIFVFVFINLLSMIKVQTDNFMLETAKHNNKNIIHVIHFL